MIALEFFGAISKYGDIPADNPTIFLRAQLSVDS
jgi:hypothetical protein